MSAKRIIVGKSAWGVSDEDAADLLKQIESALQEGTVLRLSLTDGENRPVTVFINGRTVETVAVDLDEGPRPSEISG